MLVKSYLAIPKPDMLKELSIYLGGINNCEVVIPYQGDEALVVVTESADQNKEDETILKIQGADSLDHMVLVSSFNDANN